MKLYGKTDIGRRRKNNQDSFVIRRYEEIGAALGLVCDGMGGASGGNIASALACEKFLCRIDAFFAEERVRHGVWTEGDVTSTLAHAVADANQAVYRRAAKDSSLRGMGTTLVAALVIGETLYAVNVGDSRLYLYARGRLTQITKDHSLVQYLIDTGKLTSEEAKSYPSRNVITRAIGTESSIEADIFSVDLSTLRGDQNAMAMLCSDGLSSYVDAEVIRKMLAEHETANTAEEKSDADSRENGQTEKLTDKITKQDEDASGNALLDALIAAANDAGGVDNVTVVLMRQLLAEDDANADVCISRHAADTEETDVNGSL